MFPGNKIVDDARLKAFEFKTGQSESGNFWQAIRLNFAANGEYASIMMFKPLKATKDGMKPEAEYKKELEDWQKRLFSILDIYLDRRDSQDIITAADGDFNHMAVALESALKRVKMWEKPIRVKLIIRPNGSIDAPRYGEFIERMESNGLYWNEWEKENILAKPYEQKDYKKDIAKTTDSLKTEAVVIKPEVDSSDTEKMTFTEQFIRPSTEENNDLPF